ncbi:MAG: DNA repair protein RecO [Saprospiraceae bacterium]|nr:DNA repair protein RecO [Saprospiraceae bacterium]
MSKLQKEKGIILRSFKYGESSLILDILTTGHGLQSFIIQNVRKVNSKTSPSSTQLAASVDVDFYFKENAELFRLKEIKVNNIRVSLYSDIRKMSIAMFLVEISRKILNKYEQHEEEYYLLSNVLDDLEKFADNWSIHIWYLLRIQDLHGISILRQHWDTGKYFDILIQSETNVKPGHPSFFDRDELLLLKEINLMSVRDMSQIFLNRNKRNELLEKLIGYIRMHIPGLLEIKSLEILKTVFD